MQDRSPLSLRRQWRSADHPNPGPGPCSGARAQRDVPERKESNQGLIFVCEWRCATTAKCYSNNRANCRFQWGEQHVRVFELFQFFFAIPFRVSARRRTICSHKCALSPRSFDIPIDRSAIWFRQFWLCSKWEDIREMKNQNYMNAW